MLLIPCVWTRFVIVVGSAAATPPSAILSQLSWCRDRPIDLVIVSKDPDWHAIDSQQERAQVLLVMEILIDPHIHRFRELCFDVTFSSSLPPFPDSFHGTASILGSLRLDSMEDDGDSMEDGGDSIEDDGDAIDTSTEQQFPALTRLAIDGRNYYNACRKDSRWTVDYPGVLDLTISHYAPLPSESFSTSKFLRPITLMPNLRCLNMTDLTLHPSFTHTTDQNLPPLLYAWEGDSLQVINCPSFNDAVLDIMGDYDYDNACFFGASRASSLEIHDCLYFSGAALRCLVATRLNRDEFTTVEVSGHAPEITAEDVEWLSQNVNRFVYNPSRS
jgi:hypothetical protein